MYRAIVLLSFVIVGCAQQPIPNLPPEIVANVPAEKALAQLQGKWKLVAEERNGEAVASGKVQQEQTSFFVKDDQLTISASGRPNDVYRIQLDPDAAARNLDLYARGYEKIGFDNGKKIQEFVDEELLAQQGIYSLDGDTLKLCVVGGDRERPTAFRTTSGGGRSDFTLYVLKRD